MADLTLEDLDRLYKPMSPIVKAKVLDRVDRHGATFISLSPFVVVSAAGPDGAIDVSPRGGEPGFVKLDGERTLFLPDRPGNNRLDIIRSLLAGPGRIGMMFMIPGVDDVYRVNGSVTATEDPALLARFPEFGKLPKILLRVAVEEAFLHCPKALMRSKLWEAEAQIDRALLPSGAEMVMDQLGMGKPPVSNDVILDSYREQL